MSSVKSYGLLLVLSLSIIFAPAPAVGMSIVPFPLSSAASEGLSSCYHTMDLPDFLRNGVGDTFSLLSLAREDHGSSMASPFMVLVGLPPDDIASSIRENERLTDLLIPLFLGSFLIALSGGIRSLMKKQKAEQHAEEEVNAGVSYKDTLTLET